MKSKIVPVSKRVHSLCHSIRKLHPMGHSRELQALIGD
jgi:hypothetical protein